MEPNTRGSGRKINNTAKERKLGQMEQCTRVTTYWVRNMVQEGLDGQTAPYIMVNSLTTTLREWENINGQMGVPITESGEIIRCMVEESSLGLMAESTKVSMWKIRNRGRALSTGLMAENTLDNG
jgi:hypothetical protein